MRFFRWIQISASVQKIHSRKTENKNKKNENNQDTHLMYFVMYRCHARLIEVWLPFHFQGLV